MKKHTQQAEFFDHQVSFFSQRSNDGNALQHQIDQARIMVIGAGLIGAQTLLTLAQTGFNNIHLHDQHQITESDLAANLLLKSADLKQSRAQAVATNLRQFNFPSLNCQVDQEAELTETTLTKMLNKIDCLLVCLDAPAPLLLDLINRVTLQTNTRWLTAQVYQGCGWLGPLVIPQQTACWKCYEQRRNANLENYAEIAHYEARLRQLPTIRSEFIAPRPLAATLAGLMVMELTRLITKVALPQLANHILRVELLASTLTYHRILRLPYCPDCGR